MKTTKRHKEILELLKQKDKWNEIFDKLIRLKYTEKEIVWAYVLRWEEVGFFEKPRQKIKSKSKLFFGRSQEVD